MIKKPDIKVAFIGGEFLKDAHATFEFNVKQTKTTNRGRWDSIAVCHEFAYEQEIEDNNILPWDDKLWGPSYFLDCEAMNLGRNWFMSEVDRVCRYAIGSVQQCRQLLGNKNLLKSVKRNLGLQKILVDKACSLTAGISTKMTRILSNPGIVSRSSV